MNIVLATTNKGKIRELSTMLANFNIIPLTEFNIADIEETGQTFVENAILKARETARITNTAVISDDSGLCVDALHGAPGIYSARYAGLPSNSNNNITKLLADLKDEANRRAYFYCVLVYLRFANDPTPIICEGKWEGIITNEKKGTEGFGYDPIFYIPEEKMTAAELSPERKNQISHRAKALSKLKTRIISL